MGVWCELVDVVVVWVYVLGDEFVVDGCLDLCLVVWCIVEFFLEDCVVVFDGGYFIGWVNMYWFVVVFDWMMMVGIVF